MARQINLLDHGYVRLLDVMGSDEDIVDAARISYDRQGKTKDRNLIRYLMRNRHTSPFEMGEMKFEIKCPMFVARQWVRHRTASLNEVSGRYTQLPAEMWVPEKVSVQSDSNKQGRGDEIQDDSALLETFEETNNFAYDSYNDLLESGVAKEMARSVLPLSTYTKFVWKMDVHNLMHFLNLRLHPHAQEEIRVYAVAIEAMLEDHFPISHEAFVDYVRDSYTLSRMETNVLFGGFMLKGLSRQHIESTCKNQGLSNREIEVFMDRFCTGKHYG